MRFVGDGFIRSVNGMEDAMEMVEYIADTPINLSKPFDLNFIHTFGTVFKVVDNNAESANLCFGIESDGKRYFVKFAGAPKENIDLGTVEESVEWLKQAAWTYQALEHKNLIKFIKGEEIGGGYAAVFEWVDAECIGISYPAARQKFLNLPTQAKLQAFDDILNFHAHVAEREYVAIDFYSDQVMYSFENGQTTICDIDFYRESPYYGDKGLWGSANFVSPEECVPGSRVDEVTMVYTMGATAFSIFTDHSRDYEVWTLSRQAYDVAAKAVSNDRDMRQQSVQQFRREWKESRL